MSLFESLKNMFKGQTKASKQAQYKALLARKLKNRSFAELSEAEREEVLKVAAKDFSSKFADDIAVLANE